jgi:hypothetical protein
MPSLARLPPPAQAASSALLRKAGVRVVRDTRLRVARDAPRARLLALATLALLCAAAHRHAAHAPAEADPGDPFARAAAGAGVPACACGDARWPRVRRVLDGSDFVARVTVVSRRVTVGDSDDISVLRIHTLFRGPPRLVLEVAVVSSSQVHSCSSFLYARHPVDVSDKAGDGAVVDVDDTFLVASNLPETSISRQLNATILAPGSACGAVWAVRWMSLAADVRDSIDSDPAVRGDSWWRETDRWQRTESEWWPALSGPETSSVQPATVLPPFNSAPVTAASLDQTQTVSIIASCKDRSGTLAIASESWIDVRGVSEIVLLDWSSAVSILSLLPRRVASDPRLVSAAAPGQAAWVLSRAYNVALRLAKSTAVLKVDCDTVLKPEFLEAHPLQAGEFYSGDWRLLGSPEASEHLHANGLLYASRSDLIAVGGYDERVTTYGWDDTDIAMRLGRLLSAQLFDYSKLRHEPHPDVLRTASQHHMSLLPPDNPLAARVEIQRNRILLTKFNLPSWRYDSFRVQWNVALSPTGIPLFLPANALSSVTELVSEADGLDVAKRSIRIILLRYGVSLLPKTLSLSFYKRLAAQVGFADQYAELVAQVRGGCASRLLSLAASHAVTTGLPVLDTSFAAGDEVSKAPGKVDAMVLPPPPYLGWRLRLLWRQPDIGCSCRFYNVFIVPDVEILATLPDTTSTNASLWLSGTTHRDSESVSYNIRNLLETASTMVLSDLRRGPLAASLVCDIEPKLATEQHREAVRASMRTLLPTSATRNTVMASLHRKLPTILDNDEVTARTLSSLLDPLSVTELRSTYGQPTVRAMAAAWGTSAIISSHVHHHLDRRALAICAIMLDYKMRGDKVSATVPPLVRSIDGMFAGCPGAAADYLQAYPELAIVISGLTSADVCLSGPAH